MARSPLKKSLLATGIAEFFIISVNVLLHWRSVYVFKNVDPKFRFTPDPAFITFKLHSIASSVVIGMTSSVPVFFLLLAFFVIANRRNPPLA